MFSTMHTLSICTLAVLVRLCLCAIEPRVTDAAVLAPRQSGGDSCWTSSPFESCIGELNNEPGLCQGSALFPPSTPDASYTSCACSTNSIYLPCWSSYCSGDPNYGFTLSEFERDSTIFCVGGAGGGAGVGTATPATTASPGTASATGAGGATTTTGGAATTAGSAAAASSTKSDAAPAGALLGGSFALLSAIVATGLAAGAVFVL